MSTSLLALLIVLVMGLILFVILDFHPIRRLLKLCRQRLREPHWDELGRNPVFSAETANGHEAEYVNERLPENIPRWVKLLLALSFLLIAAYWLIDL